MDFTQIPKYIRKHEKDFTMPEAYLLEKLALISVKYNNQLDKSEKLASELHKVKTESLQEKPKVRYFDELVEAKTHKTLAETAKELKIGRVRLEGMLVNDNFICLDMNKHLFVPTCPESDLLVFKNDVLLVTTKGLETFKLLYT